METLMDTDIDDFVYQRVVDMGGSFIAKRGENFENNVARAVVESRPKLTLLEKKQRQQQRRQGGAPQLRKFSNRQIYQSVCRLVQEGRLVRENTVDVDGQYGSASSPKLIEYDAAKFSVVS